MTVTNFLVLMLVTKNEGGACGNYGKVVEKEVVLDTLHFITFGAYSRH